MIVIKNNFNLKARARELWIEINENDGCGYWSFPLWSKNGLSCKKINFEQSQLLLKLFQNHFRYGSELDMPEICHWDAQLWIPATGKLPLVWRVPRHCTTTESCPYSEEHCTRDHNRTLECWIDNDGRDDQMDKVDRGKIYGWTSGWSCLRIPKMGIKPYVVQA